MTRAIDHELWQRARAVFGDMEAVVLMTCPRCGQRTLTWSGLQDAGTTCINPWCGLSYQKFKDLVDGHEQYLEAQRAEAMRAMVERHDTYRRVGRRVRQVRHG